MKTMMLAAVTALSLGAGSAFAADAPRAGGYAYPNFWGTSTTAQQVPAANAQPAATGTGFGVFATQSGHTGTYLFPPNPYSNG